MKNYIKLFISIILLPQFAYSFTPIDSCYVGQVFAPSGSNPVVAGLATIAEINYVLCSRYVTANGDSDTGFGDEGVAITTHGTSAQASALAIQTSNDKIVVAGSATVSGTENFCVMRYDTDGTLDSTFGTSGIATTVIGAYAPGTAYSAQIVSNNRFRTIVRVTKITSSTVEEAATNEVVVHLISIGR